MRRTLLITGAAVLGFFSVVLYRMPASWLTSLLPPQVGCTVVDGSVWSGHCKGLYAGGRLVGNADWTLHPLALLALKLAVHVVLNSQTAMASADVETRSASSVTLRNVVADLPLDQAVLPQLPPTLRGHAHLTLERVRLTDGVVTALEGAIEVRDLVDRSMGETQLGSYALSFPPDATGDPVGRLHDLGGPLSVEGTLLLTPKPGYKVDLRVGARPSASPVLRQNLQYLQIMGPPDAQGRYPYTQEGVF
jgi:hypothetical protein